MKDKNLMESIEVMQRILISILKDEKVSDNDILKLESLNNMLKNDDILISSDEYLMKVVTSYLKELGISTNLKGFNFLRVAIIMKFKNSYISFTKEIYSNVAKQFDSTPSRVERGIRHAIESGWSKGSTKKQEQLFGYSYPSNHSKPTSSMFIASIVDDMKINL